MTISQFRDTSKPYIHSDPNTFSFTQMFVKPEWSDHVEYPITIYILLRHYLVSWASNCFTAPLGYASIDRRVLRHITGLWNNFWMKQRASPGPGPIRCYFSFLHVLEVFQFSIYSVDTQNDCNSITAYLQSMISSLHVLFSNFHPSRTLSHSLFPLNCSM